MAKRHEKFGAGVDPKDSVKVTKKNLSKAIKIFRFVIPYKWTFVLGMVFLLLSNLTTLSFPLLIGEMTKVIEGKSKFQINEVTLFFFAILILYFINFCNTIYAIYFGVGFTTLCMVTFSNYSIVKNQYCTNHWIRRHMATT